MAWSHSIRYDITIGHCGFSHSARMTFWIKFFKAVANSSNEGGILSGAWHGEWKDNDGNLIDGCTRPSSWSGSVKASNTYISCGHLGRLTS